MQFCLCDYILFSDLAEVEISIAKPIGGRPESNFLLLIKLIYATDNNHNSDLSSTMHMLHV
jgi:hypothetical protein